MAQINSIQWGLALCRGRVTKEEYAELKEQILENPVPPLARNAIKLQTDFFAFQSFGKFRPNYKRFRRLSLFEFYHSQTESI